MSSIEESAEIPENILPFSGPKQEAILGYLVFGENKNFFLKSMPLIQPDWFVDGWCRKIFAVQVSFYKKFQRIPSPQELKDAEEFRYEEQGVRNRISGMMSICDARRSEYGLDVLKTELTTWLHSVQLKRRLTEAQNFYNRKEVAKAISIVRQGVQEIEKASFEEEEEVVWDDLTVFDRQKSELANALTFGIDSFDRLLTPTAKKGCLLRGDTTVILAPVNIGKSTCMITVGVANVLHQKSVLYITHEGRKDDLMIKCWANMCNMTQAELYSMYDTQEGREKMVSPMSWLKRYLTYVPMNKAGLTVEEVAAIIRRKNEERIAKYGTGYDLIIDDYPQRLTTEIGKNGQFAKRHLDDYVYGYFVQLALELNAHMLLAIQTNRMGSKVNRGDEDRLLFMEDVSESWGPMMAATNVVSINRSPIAEARGFVTYNICKSRSSDRGWAVCCKSRYEWSKTHDNAFGSTWYKGTSNNSDKIASLLETYKNQAIPEGLVE